MNKPDIKVDRTTIGNVVDILADNFGDNISSQQIPRYIFFAEEFPATASGKIQKYKLREMEQHAVS